MKTTATIATVVTLCTLVTAGCAGGRPPALPYPAFIPTDELPDVFLAALPGVRAKQLAGDMHTRTASNRVDIPPDWTGSTGGSPGKALELFVMSGELRVGDIALGAGGYLYVPPGSLGFRLASDHGARILYFLNDVPATSVIRAPLLLDSNLVEWQETSPGIFTKVLREDPGSGARTWLYRVTPVGVVPWQSSTVGREGYLLRGQYRHSECLDGLAATGEYGPGGYFRRPPGAINGGPESRAETESVWFLRESSAGERNEAVTCGDG
ncbi:MAG: hypothetical protein R3288_10140 [Woeseiaceae bacterium]|nr:hypothetical protein [Woeseiaceae bacterium]